MYIGLESSKKINKRRTFLLLLAFPASLYLLSFIVTFFTFFQAQEGSIEYLGLMQDAAKYSLAPFCFIFFLSLIWLGISFYFQKSLIFKFSGAKELERKHNKRVYNIVENLCIQAGIGSPKIGIIETNSLNAFALGYVPEKSWIVFTRGLVNKLDDKELEAVAGHELTHILNKDTLVNVLIVLWIGILGTLGYYIMRIGMSSKSSNKKDGAGMLILIGVLLMGLSYLVFPLIKFAISRKREYLADAGSVDLTKDADSMKNALLKISGNSHIELENAKIAIMCIESPIESIFSTHPPIESRIKALNSYG